MGQNQEKEAIELIKSLLFYFFSFGSINLFFKIVPCNSSVITDAL